MNHTKWVAWGVVNVEALDKQQRRSYLKKLRGEMAEVGFTLHPGGSTQVPWYRVEGTPESKAHTIAGTDALKNICAWVLTQVGEADVSSEDGSLRSAGGEAPAPDAGEPALPWTGVR